MGSGNGERTVLDGHDDIGERDGRRLAGVAVDNLEARLRRAAWAHQHLEGVGQVANAEIADVLSVHRVRKPELFTYGDVRRCIGGQRLSDGRNDSRH